MKVVASGFGRSVRFLIFVGLLWSVLPGRVASLLVNDHVTQELAESRVAACFALSSSRWMEFLLAPGQMGVKIVSNAGAPSDLYGMPDLVCEYTIRYQIATRGGKVLRDGESVFRSTPLLYRDEASGNMVPAQTFIGVPFIPLSSRSAVLNLEDSGDEPAVLKVMRGHCDPRLNDIVVRVYQNEKPADYKLRYLWQRMPLEKQTRLARGNVHEVDLLTAAEKRNLLENRWVAVAPQGIVGDDYVERKLFTLRERATTQFSQSTLPRGLLVGEGTLGVIAVPEAGGCLRLSFQPLESNLEPPVVSVRILGRRSKQPRVEVLDLLETGLEVNLEVEGGLVELESPTSVIVLAFMDWVAGGVEVTPEPRAAQCFVVRPGTSIEYAVLGRQDEAGSFRLDLRRPVRSSLQWPGRGVSVQFELLDQRGTTLGVGRIRHDNGVSWYDSLSAGGKDVDVTDPSRAYLVLPAGCSRVRVTTEDEEVYVSAHTRPSSLVRSVDVPQDYQAYERAQDDSRNWFPLRPLNYPEIIGRAGEVFVRAQQRPGDVAAVQEVRVVPLYPLRPAETRQALTPVDLDEDDPAQGGRGYFARLPALDPVELLLLDSDGEGLVRPRVFSLGAVEGESTARLYSAHRLLGVLAHAGAIAEQRLDPIEGGWHLLRAESEPKQDIFIGPITPPGADLYTLKAAHRLTPEGLTFRMRKVAPGKESLFFRAYPPAATSAPLVMTVSLRGPPRAEGVPSDSWTFLETTYVVSPPPGDRPAYLVDQKEEPLYPTDAFLLLVGNDLGPGEYEIAVRLLEGPKCYLTLQRVVPGRRESFRIYNERIEENESSEHEE